MTATARDQMDLQRDAEALHAAVSDLVRVYQFRDRDRICCYDISVTQCYALEAVAEHGPMRLGVLAERLYLDKSTTSRVVGTLVRKRYLEQRRDPLDGRATNVAITSSGRRLYERITDDLIEQQKRLLQDLDPRTRGRVVLVLRRLARTAESRFLSGLSVGSTGSGHQARDHRHKPDAACAGALDEATTGCCGADGLRVRRG